MSWFSKKRGIDINVLRKTKYWNKITELIETDEATQQKLVQYIYEIATDAMVSELERTRNSQLSLDKVTHEYLLNRIALIKSYRELAYGSDRKPDTDKS